MDNYALQTKYAQKRFLSYDQEVIIRKFSLTHDRDYLYVKMLSAPYRLCRKTGALERQEKGSWVDANTFNEVLTLLDVLCDAKEHRALAGEIQATQNFGHQFHSGLLESGKDPLAEVFDRNVDSFCRSCTALGGRSVSGGDKAFAIELLDGLEITVMFWHGDEDFPAQLRYFWDKNALQYIKYETMYYALGLLKQRLGSLLSP